MFRCFSLVAVLVLVFLVSSVPFVWAGESEAAVAIVSARRRVVVCFEAAVEAEAAGANITGLADVLNGASGLLSRAELAFSVGDFVLAERLAVESEVGLAGFVSDAGVLREEAVRVGSFDFYVVFLGSVVGTFVVIGVGFAVWLYAKRRFAREVVGEGELSWRDVD